MLESESDPAFNVLQPLLTHHTTALTPSIPETTSNGCCVSCMGDAAHRPPAHSGDSTPCAAGSGLNPCEPPSGGSCSVDSTRCTGPVLSTSMCSKGDQHTLVDPLQANSSHSGCSVGDFDVSDGSGATCAAFVLGGYLSGCACHGGRNVGAPGLEANSSCGMLTVRIVVAGLSQQCSQKAHKWVGRLRNCTQML